MKTLRWEMMHNSLQVVYLGKIAFGSDCHQTMFVAIICVTVGLSF